MSIEQVIIDVSTSPIKGLAPRAAKAMNSPETGVNILIPAAKLVIRDCAMVTVKYLPIMLYGQMVNPIEILKKRIKRSEVVAMYERGKSEAESMQLTKLMFMDAHNKLSTNIQTPPVTPTPKSDDVYSDYDTYLTPVASTTNISFNMSDRDNVIKVICDGFEVIE